MNWDFLDMNDKNIVFGVYLFLEKRIYVQINIKQPDYNILCDKI